MSGSRKAKIQSYLQSEGYAAKIDADGDIVFKYNRVTMILEVEDRDVDFYKVTVLSAVEPYQVGPALKACEEINLSLKVVKALVHPTPTGGTVLVSVESLHSSVDEFLRFLERYLDMAHASFKKIAEAL